MIFKISLLVIIFSLVSIDGLFSQNNDEFESTEIITNSGNDYSNSFFTTLCRTPFAIITLMGTFAGCAISILFEVVANIFTLFKHGFGNTESIWNIGFNQIVVDWWWDKAVGWHLLVSFIILSAIGGKKR